MAEKRAGDSRGIEIKETGNGNIEDKQRDGRPLGHKKQRAIIGPRDQRGEKSPQVEDPCGGPKNATENNEPEKNMTEKNYKVKDQKGGLKNVTERSKIAAAPVLIHATSVKGKE